MFVYRRLMCRVIGCSLAAWLVLMPLAGAGGLFLTRAEDPLREPGLSREASESAAIKLGQVEQGGLPGYSFGSLRLSEAEANSFLHYEIARYYPPGVSKIRLQFRPNRPRGATRVDFDKIKGAMREPPNPLVDYFLQGVHDLEVEGTFSSAHGYGRFDLETVWVDGVMVPRFVVDYLVEKYVKARYPNVVLNRTFALPYSLDQVSVEEGSVLFINEPAN